MFYLHVIPHNPSPYLRVGMGMTTILTLTAMFRWLKKAKTSINYNRCFKWSPAECSPSLLCLLPRHLDGHFVPQFFLHTFHYFHILNIAGLSHNFSCTHFNIFIFQTLQVGPTIFPAHFSIFSYFKHCRLAASCLSTGACLSLSS